MNARRVLVVTNMWPGEGHAYAGIFVQRQVEALRAAAPERRFDVFTMAGHRGRADYLRAVPRLRRQLREGYDVVHAHYGFTGATAAIAGARPLMVTLHGGDVNIGWQRIISRFAARRADSVIAVSDRLRSAWNGPEATVLSCGVPTDQFCILDRGEARRELGIDRDALVVLFPADPAVPVKDHPLFVRTLDALPAPIRSRLVVRTLAGVAPATAHRHVAAADVVLLTSKQESGPLVVKEALACGVPVVSVDVGDVPVTLAGLDGCAVVVQREPAALAASVERVLRDWSAAFPADELQRRRELLRRRVFELGLDDPSVARRLLAIYDAMANAGRQIAERT